MGMTMNMKTFIIDTIMLITTLTLCVWSRYYSYSLRRLPDHCRLEESHELNSLSEQ